MNVTGNYKNTNNDDLLGLLLERCLIITLEKNVTLATMNCISYFSLLYKVLVMLKSQCLHNNIKKY